MHAGHQRPLPQYAIGIIMKAILPALLLVIFSISSTVAGDYNTDYCHDPVELQKWEQMLSNDPGSEPLAAIHALWIGLCVKVEKRHLTTTQANRIFERFREALIEQIQSQHAAPEQKGS